MRVFEKTNCGGMKMENIAVFLGILAGALHLVAFAIYNKQMILGTSRPNTATWTLWVILTVLNLASYKAMSGDIVKAILPLASSLAGIVTFIFAIAKGKLSRLGKFDSLALIIGLVSGGTWWYYNSATFANLILQAAIVVSFIPTYRGVWQDPKMEKALPWFIWASAYVLTIAVVFLRWRDQYQDLVYPLNGLILHTIVGMLAMRKKES